MKNAKRLIYALLTLAVAACNDAIDETTDMVEMPVTIAIPAAGFSSPMDVGMDGEAAESRDTRAPGDPGSDEKLELPQYLYIYMVTTTGGTSNVSYAKFTVKKEEWKLSTDADNENDHFNDVKRDGLYVYQGHLSVAVPANREKGKVYVAASDVDLEQHGLKTRPASPGKTAEEITVNGSAELSAHIKNLYSTPYNLKNKNGEYYGTIQDFADKVPHVDVVLYHTATKLDVQWQTDEDCQGVKDAAGTADMSAEDEGKVFFSYIEACNLPKTFPLFMPMNCTQTEGTYAAPLLADTNNKALRYNGRCVTYVVPRRYTNNGNDYFMGLRMVVNNYNGETDKGHYAYIRIQDESLTQEDGSPIYTPWLRAFVHVTKDNVGKLVELNEERQYETIR